MLTEADYIENGMSDLWRKIGAPIYIILNFQQLSIP